MCSDVKRCVLRSLAEDCWSLRSEGLSASIEMWRDNYVRRNFLGVTLHYMIDNKFNGIVIGMKSMDFERTTSHDIIKRLQSVFQEFGVDNIESIKFLTNRSKNIIKALENNLSLNCSSHLLSNVIEKSF